MLTAPDKIDQTLEGGSAVENGRLGVPLVVGERAVAAAHQGAAVHLGFESLTDVACKIAAVDQAVLASMLVFQAQHIAIEMIGMPDRGFVAVRHDAGDAGLVVLPGQFPMNNLKIRALLQHSPVAVGH